MKTILTLDKANQPYGFPQLNSSGSLTLSGSILSGSFSGSFQGNGSGLTNIPASGITGLNLSQIATGSISASVSLGTGSFTVTSGSSTFMFVSSSGNIGINTVTPSAKLDINGTTTLQGNITAYSRMDMYGTLYMNNNIQLITGNVWLSNGYAIGEWSTGNTRIEFYTNKMVFVTNGNDIVTIPNSGNVLIGTTTDSGYKLDVNGTFRASGFIYATANMYMDGSIGKLRSNWGGLELEGASYVQINNPTLRVNNQNFTLTNTTFTPNNSTNSNLILSGNGAATGFTNGGAGGTSIGNVCLSNINIQTAIGNVTLNHFNIQNTISSSAGTTLQRGFYYNPTLTSTVGFSHRSIETTSGDVLLGTTSGRVAIGTSADTGHELLVSGSGASGSVNLNNTLYVSGSRVGIGTSTPSQSLDISGNINVLNSSNTTLDILTLRNTSTGNTNQTRIRFYNDSGATPGNGGIIFLTGNNYSGFPTNSFGLWNESSNGVIALATNNTERLRLFSNGNLAINTTTDAGFKLDVNGTVRSQGNLFFGTAGSYLLGDANNTRIVDKNNTIILQSFPSGVSNSETYLRSANSTISFLRLREDYISLEYNNGAISQTTQNPIQITRGFFGNVVATDKSVLHIRSPFFSNLNNATTLRGIFIDINDTTTFTGFTTVRAIEAPRGGAYFNTTSPQASAVLQADSTTQGFLPPRMTGAQAELISSPAEGLMVYATDGTGVTITSKGWWGYNGATWEKLN